MSRTGKEKKSSKAEQLAQKERVEMRMKNNYLALSMLRRLEQEKDKLGRNKLAVPANPSFFSAGGSRRTDGRVGG